MRSHIRRAIPTGDRPGILVTGRRNPNGDPPEPQGHHRDPLLDTQFAVPVCSLTKGTQLVWGFKAMADLPKATKDADDLSKVGRTPSWRKTLTSALGAVAASVMLGSLSAPLVQAVPNPGVRAGTTSVSDPTGPAKLVFQQNAGSAQAADHYSHESHFSHVSHHSHYSGFQG
jgi:hypothetical protein